MRLIDADALIAQMKADIEQMYEPMAKLYANAGIQYVKHAPTIKPEQKKARWIVEPYSVENDTWAHRCGECLQFAMIGGGKPLFKYCPNCGARMEVDA